MIYAPNMLLIGAAGRDAGKTTFACALVQRFQAAAIQAAKVTAVQERDGACPRGGRGCGVCSSLDAPFCLTEETDAPGAKDTQRLLASGATRVFWLRVLKTHLEEGARALLDALGADTPVICESNSLRQVVVPGVFLMVRNRSNAEVKASAEAVKGFAHAVVLSDGNAFDMDFTRIRLNSGGWSLATEKA